MAGKKQQSLGKIEAELEDEFARWDYLKIHGGSDPFWSDGVNMNLVRNHIIYYKRMIEDLEPEVYPEAYLKETPPEVHPDYMARGAEIRNAAIENLEAITSNGDLLFLRAESNVLSSAERARVSIGNVMRYEDSLREAIRNNNLVAMRRFWNMEGYLEDIKKCRERVEDILNKRDGKEFAEEDSGQICFAFAM